MSGGGGGGSGWREPDPQGGGGTDGQPGDPCDLTHRAPLASPSPSVIQTLIQGDLLDVVLVAGPPTVVEVRTKAGKIAGSITAVILAQLTDCLRNGVQYEAEVISIRGGICVVEVRRK